MKDWIEVFEAGDYGKKKGSYTEKDLDRFIEIFSNEKAGLPITIDHAKKGPSYGYIDKIKRDGKILKAHIGKINENLEKAIDDGHFRNISVEIAPQTGSKEWRLRAITVLGAATPQVKSLEALSFSDNSIDFGEEEEFISIDFEENKGGASMDEELKKEIEQLKVKNEALIKQFSDEKAEKEKIEKEIEDIKAKQLEAEQEAEEKEVNEFCDRMIEEGKILPAEKDFIVKTAAGLDSKEIKEFSDEEGNTANKTERAAYLDSIKSRESHRLLGETIKGVNSQRRDFSECTGSEDAIMFSEVNKRCKELNIPLLDTAKRAEIAREVLDELGA